ncbi:MAG TPA: DUF2335 domain-containing protein [Acidobacteriaceae bacterium]
MKPEDSDFSSEGNRISRINAVALTSYSGPLPPPEILARFEELYPGSAKLIIDDFLSESVQRREAERKILPSLLFRQTLGAISASLLGIVGLGGGIWLSHEGRSLGGLSSVLGTLGTLLAIFLYQNRKSE